MALVRKTDIDKNDAIGRHLIHIPFITAVSQTAKAFWFRVMPDQLRVLAARVYASAYTATASVKVYNSSGEEILSGTALAIDATPEKFQTSSKLILISGGQIVEKAATTAITFTAAHVVSSSKFGVILVQVDKTTGVYSTKVPLATQAYTSAPLALAALPAADTGCLVVGYIAIAAKAATWTANTDDMTNGSDLTTATFTDGTAYTSTPLVSITPVALKTVTGTLGTDYRLTVGRVLVAVYTTDGSGVLTNGALDLDVRPEGMRGDPLFTG